MSKSYLVIERGLAGERVFHLQSRLTIGRAPESDIHLPDPSISRQHALAYIEDEKAILEDMGSRNGTYVNEERVKKALLSSGDLVRFGNITVRFFTEEGLHGQAAMKETREFNCWTSLDAVKNHSSLQRSRRLVESVSNILLFSSLDRQDLDLVCKAANLLVCNPGQSIIRHGDWGDSLYIILDGRVRILTYDHQGKDITLQLLSENRFFGEYPLLTGSPHMTAVEAVEETLLCQFSFETIGDLAERYPIVKGLLEQSHIEYLDCVESRRKSLGFKRRKYPRFKVSLQVSFSVSPGLEQLNQLKQEMLEGVSTEISLLGVRIRVEDKSLNFLPVGCHIRLEIVLLPPWESIRCIGILRHMMDTEEGDDELHIGIEFSDMSSASEKTLENFLYSCLAAEG